MSTIAIVIVGRLITTERVIKKRNKDLIHKMKQRDKEYTTFADIKLNER